MSPGRSRSVPSHFPQQVVDPRLRCDFIEGKVDPNSPLRPACEELGLRRLALERQAADAFRSGMVGMLFQPGSQLRKLET